MWGFFFFSSRRRHTRLQGDWSSDVCSSDLTVPTPGHLKMTNEFASIGLGFGTALGVAKGRPHTPTVLIIGDGGFLMTLSELETAIREDIPLIIVLMNDCAYGAELHFLALRKLPVGKSV